MLNVLVMFAIILCIYFSLDSKVSRFRTEVDRLRKDFDWESSRERNVRKRQIEDEQQCCRRQVSCLRSKTHNNHQEHKTFVREVSLEQVDM